MPDRPDPSLTDSILARCEDLGFALAGIADARPSNRRPELMAWLAEGKHGEMGYLEEHAELRADPAKVLEGAKSAILVADLYASRDDNVDTPLEPGEGRIARYCRGRDYHTILKKRLMKLADALRAEQPTADFRVFTDTAPVMERELAARAGLGWVGKHTLVIHPKVGSYFLLGGILTSLDLTPPASQTVVTDHCGSCTRCIDACPTDAITPYSVDARRCISYLTIEHRSPIDPALEAKIGSWIFGCDICQEACPHNSSRPEPPMGKTPNPAYRPERDRFDLLAVINWTADDRRTAFRGSAMKRAKLGMMQRNAAIALKNNPTDPV
ncbi:MAG: tRNA epoxyqueuosine(34) reductase QueG [Planctomycetota bacterium]